MSDHKKSLKIGQHLANLRHSV